MTVSMTLVRNVLDISEEKEAAENADSTVPFL